MSEIDDLRDEVESLQDDLDAAVNDLNEAENEVRALNDDSDKLKRAIEDDHDSHHDGLFRWCSSPACRHINFAVWE